MAVDPPPQCLFMGIKDSYAHYVARYWLTDLREAEKQTRENPRSSRFRELATA